MLNSSIERISFISLGGILIAIISLFMGNRGQLKGISYSNSKNLPFEESLGHKQTEQFIYNGEKLEKLRVSQELAKILKNKDLLEEAIEENKKIILLDEKFVQAHLELARLYWSKRNISASIAEYRRVAELAPDYIDNHSQVFLGEEIKSAIKETINELKMRNKANPGDKAIQQGIKDAYYLTRKIGAGCD